MASFGLKVAWQKAFSGASVSFHGPPSRDLAVELPEEKVAKIISSFNEIRSHKGAFPTRLLESPLLGFQHYPFGKALDGGP